MNRRWERGVGRRKRPSGEIPHKKDWKDLKDCFLVEFEGMTGLGEIR